MHEAIMRRCSFKTRGLHHTFTNRLTITRIHIDMLAPEAVRTVVGVSVTFHERSAVLTNKVFYRSLEFLCHHYECTDTEPESITFAPVLCATHDNENESVPIELAVMSLLPSLLLPIIAPLSETMQGDAALVPAEV